MADKTGIEWTDSTWNPVTGCTKVSAGCKHCYAERDWARMQHLPSYAGRAFTDVATHAERLDQPLRWQKPRRIFVNSMSDLFHEAVADDFIASVWAKMAQAPQHIFQILTKRPERMRYVVSCLVKNSRMILPNVWLGVSVEDQAAADERIPLLLQTPAAVRWISAEPLLGRVDLCESFGIWWNQTMGCFESSRSSGFNRNPNNLAEKAIDWVVVGGESGPKARPMHPDWARDLRDQCAAAGVPFLFKQWGEWAHAHSRPAGEPGRFRLAPRDERAWVSTHELDAYPRQFAAFGSSILERVGKKVAGRLLDGVQHDGYPGDQA